MDAILASSVIAALIVAVFNYMQFRKSENLQYITGERAKWREEIRKISKNISNANCLSDLEPELTKLKTRINPYGRYSSNFFEDSHLWEIVDSLDNKFNDDNCIKKEKEILLSYLSLLLKRDWEISKREVKGDYHNKIKATICVVNIVAYIWTMYSYWNLELNLLTLFPILFVISSCFIIPVLSTKKSEISDQDTIIKFVISSILRTIFYFVITAYFICIIVASKDIKQIISGIFIIDGISFIIIVYDMVMTYNIYVDEHKYIRNIVRVKNTFSNK